MPTLQLIRIHEEISVWISKVNWFSIYSQKINKKNMLTWRRQQTEKKFKEEGSEDIHTDTDTETEAEARAAVVHWISEPGQPLRS